MKTFVVRWIIQVLFFGCLGAGCLPAGDDVGAETLMSSGAGGSNSANPKSTGFGDGTRNYSGGFGNGLIRWNDKEKLATFENDYFSFDFLTSFIEPTELSKEFLVLSYKLPEEDVVCTEKQVGGLIRRVCTRYGSFIRMSMPAELQFLRSLRDIEREIALMLPSTWTELDDTNGIKSTGWIRSNELNGTTEFNYILVSDLTEVGYNVLRVDMKINSNENAEDLLFYSLNTFQWK